jgi:hypothetical protein
MHELYVDCLEAMDEISLVEGEIPAWILDVTELPFVNGHFPSDHEYEKKAS